MENSEQAVEPQKIEETALAEADTTGDSDIPSGESEQPDIEELVASELEAESDDGVMTLDVNGNPVRFVQVEDHNGNPIYVQEDGKDGYLRQDDYTRKTQALAEGRREHDQRVMQNQQLFDLRQQTFDSEVKLASLDAQLKEYEGFDWNIAQQQYGQEQANAAFMQYQNLKQQRDQLNNEVQAQKGQVFQTQQAQLAQVRKQSWETLSNEVPDWSETKAQELGSFAQKVGISAAGLAMLNDGMYGADTTPMMLVLNDAMKYRQLVEKAKAKKKPQLKSVQPTKAVKGKSQPTKRLDKAKNAAEYRAMRQANKK